MVGISLTVEDKLAISKLLCELGVAYIEGGWPGSNPKDQELFTRWNELSKEERGNTRLSAFGSTRHKNKTCEEDPQVQALLASNAPCICLVAKAWNEQVEHVLEATLEQNLTMISDTVEYLVAEGREVMVDLEHFYDGCLASGYRGEQYALMCLRTAAAAGASTVVLCDTNGGTMPWVVEERTSRAVEAVADWPEVRIGVHCHNDTGLAVANSLVAVRAGAKLVQACVNGYGERTGNANLLTIIGDLQVKMGYNAIHPQNLRLLTPTAAAVAELCNQPPPAADPFVGAKAFAHKGGLHVAAVRKLPHSYNHMEPTLVGNTMQAVVSELSGKGNVLSHAEEAGFSLSESAAKVLLQRIKKMEQSGYSFEGASASVNMMILRSKEEYVRPFRVVEYSVISQNRESVTTTQEGVRMVSLTYKQDSITEMIEEEVLTNQAMIKVNVRAKDSDEEHIIMHAAEGNGPVNALSVALRTALQPYYATCGNISLEDYSVRLLDTAGSKSITRVTVEFMDKTTGKKWSTVGAHTSIIEASFHAITDGLEFGILNAEPDCALGLGHVDCVTAWQEVTDVAEDHRTQEVFEELAKQAPEESEEEQPVA